MIVIKIPPKSTAEMMKIIPKPKTIEKVTKRIIVKKLVSKMDIDDIINSKKHSNILDRAEKGICFDIAYGDASRVLNVTPSELKFYEKNYYRDFDHMTRSDRTKMNILSDKIDHNAEPSVLLALRKAYRNWKEINKDKKITEKSAINSFANFVKDNIFLTPR